MLLTYVNGCRWHRTQLAQLALGFYSLILQSCRFFIHARNNMKLTQSGLLRENVFQFNPRTTGKSRRRLYRGIGYFIIMLITIIWTAMYANVSYASEDQCLGDIVLYIPPLIVVLVAIVVPVVYMILSICSNSSNPPFKYITYKLRNLSDEYGLGWQSALLSICKCR